MKLSREQAADVIESFVNGTSGEWDWDDFTSIRLEDRELDAVRKKCADMRDKFPPTRAGQYCSDEGLEAMRRIVAELRSGGTPNI